MFDNPILIINDLGDSFRKRRYARKRPREPRRNKARDMGRVALSGGARLHRKRIAASRVRGMWSNSHVPASVPPTNTPSPLQTPKTNSLKYALMAADT